MGIDVIPLLVSLAVLALLLVVDVPIAFALGISGLTGIGLMQGVSGAANAFAAIPYNAASAYTLTVVPMFILMGLLVSHAGMIDGIFNLVQRLTRRLPGGLGIATILAATFFGGISGSSVADAATIGRVSIGEMSKRGYDKAYAAALVAAAGTVDILIPPSVALVMYGIVSGTSIGALLLAGIVPGLLTAGVYMVLIVVMAKSGKPGRGGVGEFGAQRLPKARPEDWFGMAGGALLFLIVIGGLYAGVFTATEAGALGAFASLVVSASFVVVWGAKRGTSPRSVLINALSETGALTSMIFALIVGASIFTNMLVLAGVPTAVSAWIVDLSLPKPLIIVSMLLALLPLGMFIDGLSMLLIVGPLFHPVATSLGYDGLWFAILFIKCIEIGLLTPPVGLNVFVVAGLFDDLRVEDVFRRITPFIVAEFVATGILFAFPQIITFLPAMSVVK
jgi:tripartite ATP-independent transporter DctM subunit